MHVNVRDIVHRTSAPMTQATSNLIQSIKKIILEEEELNAPPPPKGKYLSESSALELVS